MKNSSRGHVLLAALLFITLAFVTAGALYLWQARPSQSLTLPPAITAPSETITPTASATTTSQPTVISPAPADETANWKTYTSNKYSFKYPPNWFSKTQKRGIEEVTLEDPESDAIIALVINLAGYGGECMKIVNETKVPVNGKELIKTISKNDPTCNDKLPIKEIWVNLGQPGDFLTINFNPNKARFVEKLFDQILATFKFLD